MKPVELKVARIGNSRGVRLPAATLDRYHVGDRVVMEERVDGILLRPHGHVDPKLSWEDTARDMAADPAEAKDWTAWDATAADGLDAAPWDAPARKHVAESESHYTPKAVRRAKGPKRTKRR